MFVICHQRFLFPANCTAIILVVLGFLESLGRPAKFFELDFPDLLFAFLPRLLLSRSVSPLVLRGFLSFVVLSKFRVFCHPFSHAFVLSFSRHGAIIHPLNTKSNANYSGGAVPMLGKILKLHPGQKKVGPPRGVTSGSPFAIASPLPWTRAEQPSPCLRLAQFERSLFVRPGRPGIRLCFAMVTSRRLRCVLLRCTTCESRAGTARRAFALCSPGET